MDEKGKSEARMVALGLSVAPVIFLGLSFGWNPVGNLLSIIGTVVYLGALGYATIV